MNKKRIAILAAAMMGTLALGTTAFAEEGESYKIGFSFYNLSNAVWAELVEEAVAYGAEQGCEVTYVDCGEDAQQQISQIEKFHYERLRRYRNPSYRCYSCGKCSSGSIGCWNPCGFLFHRL